MKYPESSFLLLNCPRCDSFVLLYQKRTDELLDKLYLRQIHCPKELCNLWESEICRVPTLTCHSCKLLLGTIMYEKLNKGSYFAMRQSLLARKYRYLHEEQDDEDKVDDQPEVPSEVKKTISTQMHHVRYA